MCDNTLRHLGLWGTEHSVLSNCTYLDESRLTIVDSDATLQVCILLEHGFEQHGANGRQQNAFSESLLQYERDC